MKLKDDKAVLTVGSLRIYVDAISDVLTQGKVNEISYKGFWNQMDPGASARIFIYLFNRVPWVAWRSHEDKT